MASRPYLVIDHDRRAIPSWNRAPEPPVGDKVADFQGADRHRREAPDQGRGPQGDRRLGLLLTRSAHAVLVIVEPRGIRVPQRP